VEKIKAIVEDYANQLKIEAAYSGSWGDGGYDNMLNLLTEYKQSLIIKYDLRPSEFSQLDDIEVDEPNIFKAAIDRYKRQLLDEIKL
jgi:hypothetical protein